MLNRRLKLGTFWGIGLYVHWTFALLILFFAYQAADEGVVAIAFSLAIVVGVFFCVTLHEYGHALTARRFGIPTLDITLLPIGGVARLQRMPRIPWQELVVAVAGPAVNVVIVILLSIGFLCFGGFPVGFEAPLDAPAAAEPVTLFGEPSLSQFAFYMLAVNVTLVIFNMIPAFPMDGGRVFRSLLAMMMDYRKATVVASRVGLVCAALMAILALATENPNPIPVMIAVFIGFAGMAEARQVEVTESVAGLTVEQVMVRSQQSIPMDMPLWQLARFWQTAPVSSIPVVSLVGTVIGMIRLEDLNTAIAAGRDSLTTAGEMIDHQRGLGSVGIDEKLDSVVMRVGHQGRQLPVVDQEGRLVGILDLNSMVQRGRLARYSPDDPSPHDRFDAFS